MTALNRTHDASRRSWVASANAPETDFPLQNLPWGVFSTKENAAPRIGFAIGAEVLDMAACAAAGLVSGEARAACAAPMLNSVMELTSAESSALRAEIFDLLDAAGGGRAKCESFLVPQANVRMHLPAAIGDYTDFYASIHHAMRVGTMFRPDNPLMPNYKWLPVGYHGRASSVVVSGTEVRRPHGQVTQSPQGPPSFAPSRLLDYELEIGAFVRGGNAPGSSIPIARAHDFLFGLVLLNDWSARDIQSWEYQPLGPFLAKNFATTISPWVVTMEALAPFRVAATARPAEDPAPLPHLHDDADQHSGGIQIALTVDIHTAHGGGQVSCSSFADMYWTLAQMLTHHASNGCNLRAGDLLGSGTVSGPTRAEAGCLLELTQRGKEPITLPGGEQRGFLQDGDTVTLRGRCARQGFASLGFGACAGKVVAAE